MVFIFSATEKNNKYKLLDKTVANKIELIKLHDETPEGRACASEQSIINKDENKLSPKKPRKKKLTKKNKEFINCLAGKNNSTESSTNRIVIGSGFKIILPPILSNPIQ